MKSIVSYTLPIHPGLPYRRLRMFLSYTKKERKIGDSKPKHHEKKKKEKIIPNSEANDWAIPEADESNVGWSKISKINVSVRK